MKKVIFVLISLIICSKIYAQDGTVIFKKDKLVWSSSKQIVCSEKSDTVFISFGNNDEIVLKTDVQDKLKRNDLNALLVTEHKIFYQGEESYDKAGYLVYSGKNHPKAKIILYKKDLPIQLTYAKKTVNIIEFDSKDLNHQEIIRKRTKAYSFLTDPIHPTDTINIDSFSEKMYQTIDLDPSSAWKGTKVEYSINDTTFSVQGKNLKLTEELWNKFKDEESITITYKIDCKHDYFGHTREGKFVEIYIEKSAGSTYWWCLLLIPCIGVVWWIYIKNKKKPAVGKKGITKPEVIANVNLPENEVESKHKELEETDSVVNVSTSVADCEEVVTKKIESDEQTNSSQEKDNDFLLKICQEFDFSGDSTYEQVLENLKSLKLKHEKVNNDLKQCPDKIYGDVISLMKEKDSKILTSLIENAKKGSSDSKQSNYDILNKLINLLKLNLEKAAKHEQSIQTSEEITAQQMKSPANRRKMMVWMIEQLEDRGYKELNRNKTTEENFNKLSETLLSVTESQSTDEIISAAINNDELSKEQKAVLLKLFITQVNSQINNESVLIDSSISIDDFVAMIAEKVQSPNTFEEAQEIVRKNNLNILNEILESEIDDFNHEALISALRCAIVKLLNRKLEEFNADSLENAFDKISKSLNNSDKLINFLQEHGINTISEVPTAIRQEQYQEIMSSVNQKVNELFPDKHFESIQKLVNALLKLSEEARDNEVLIADALEEKISMRNNLYVSSGKVDVINLLKDYDELIMANENRLSTEITSKTEQITNLELKVNTTLQEVNRLSQKNTVLMEDSSAMIEKLQNGAEHILDACKTILHPCSDNDESQCVDIEDRLFGELQNTVSRLKTFRVADDSIPADTRKAIQEILIHEISVENSPINTICRYYAYSRLPFMTDTSREYGITFSRKNMSELYNAVETLYVQFGINLSIPDLFVAGFEEGHFENLTGQTYGDLDNLCQNSRNHFDHIDSKVKPSNVIVDVINVGYTVDGNVRRISSVLTY